MNKFRPQDLSKVYRMKKRRMGGMNLPYNWQTRIEWFPVGYKLNRRTISKQFGKLHYLACHAPKPIQKKWRVVYNQFCKKLFADESNVSMHYSNKWTAHSWL